MRHDDDDDDDSQQTKTHIKENTKSCIMSKMGHSSNNKAGQQYMPT